MSYVRPRAFQLLVAIIAAFLSTSCDKTAPATSQSEQQTTSPTPDGLMPTAGAQRDVSHVWNPREGEPYPDLELLRVGYLPATHDALVFIAQGEHLFERCGVQVTLLRYKNSPEAIRALEAGDIEVAIPGIAAPIRRIASGGSLRIIGGEAWYSAAIVAPTELAPPNSESRSDRELLAPFIGKRVGTVTDSTGDSVLRSAIRRAELDSRIDIVVYTSPSELLRALEARAVDAAMLWSPYMSLAESRNEQSLHIVLWASQLIRHPCCRQVATVDVTESHRESLIRYLSALLLARRFLEDVDNEDAVIQHVGQYVSGISPTLLHRELFEPDALAPDGHRRTEVSPNNSADAVTEYAREMCGTQQISSPGFGLVKSSIYNDLLAEAYRRVYPDLTPQESLECANEGLMTPSRVQCSSPWIGRRKD